MRIVAPRFEEIEAEVAAVSELRAKPAGTIRITATEHAADTILLPRITKLLREHPDIKIEIGIDYGLTDIVAQRFDAGVRSGEQVASGMIAVRIAPDMRMAVVGSPAYFKNRSELKKPQDLIAHNCINLRLPTHGNVYAWEFERGSRELRVRVDGQPFVIVDVRTIAGVVYLTVTPADSRPAPARRWRLGRGARRAPARRAPS